MLKIEEDLVLLTHVVRPIVDGSAIGGGSLHHINHHSGDIYLVTSWKGLCFSCLIGCVVVDSHGVLTFLLIKEGGDSVLSSELLPCLFG